MEASNVVSFLPFLSFLSLRRVELVVLVVLVLSEDEDPPISINRLGLVLKARR